jgi:DNA invertase Pin-like site-specific DNA recombinase
LDSCGIFKDAVLAILAVIAKQERVRLSERTLAGLAKARKQGRVGGRPRIAVRRDQVAAHRAEGLSISKISEKMRIPRTSVHRILKELAA